MGDLLVNNILTTPIIWYYTIYISLILGECYLYEKEFVIYFNWYVFNIIVWLWKVIYQAI